MIRLRISKWRRRSSCSSKQQCGSSAKSIIIFKRRKNEKKKKNKMATFNALQFYAFALCFLRIVCAVQCLCVSAWIFSNNITSLCTFFHVVYTVCAKTIRKKYVLYIWKKSLFFFYFARIHAGWYIFCFFCARFMFCYDQLRPNIQCFVVDIFLFRTYLWHSLSLSLHSTHHLLYCMHTFVAEL